MCLCGIMSLNCEAFDRFGGVEFVYCCELCEFYGSSSQFGVLNYIHLRQDG